MLDAKQIQLVLATAVVTVAAQFLWQRFANGKRQGPNVRMVETRPPFLPEIVTLLKSSVLCYLSSLTDTGSPHLSLMNFTYSPEDEKIIMSTRRDTTKYRAVLRDRRVAVLVHDFPAAHLERVAAARSSGEKEGETFSITLYGTVKVETGADAEKYRAAHLDRNPDQRQFIVGAGIAVLTILVDSAKICNQADQVKHWNSPLASPKKEYLAVE